MEEKVEFKFLTPEKIPLTTVFYCSSNDTLFCLQKGRDRNQLEGKSCLLVMLCLSAGENLLSLSACWLFLPFPMLARTQE